MMINGPKCWKNLLWKTYPKDTRITFSWKSVGFEAYVLINPNSRPVVLVKKKGVLILLSKP
jgi:hypothetical protein